MIFNEFKEHAIELVGAVLLKWKYEPNYETITREEVIADATQLMEKSLIGWDMPSDHVSKSELRAWCEEIIQKEVFRKTIRFPQDKIVADTKEAMAHRLLEKFCKGEL